MNKKLYKLMNWPEIEALEYCEEENPFVILGPHIHGTNVLFEMFCPGADSVELLITSGKTGNEFPMEKADDEGFFAVLVPGKIPSKYEYRIHKEGEVKTITDTYSFSGYELKEEEIRKLSCGVFYDQYKYFGAKSITVNKVSGIKFTLWAPNAVSVNLVGDFNDWNRLSHPMKKNTQAGIFELFIPGAVEGQKYLYSIKNKDGSVCLKSDPFARKICKDDDYKSCISLSEFKFSDSEYLNLRKKSRFINKGISIYEFNPCNFKKNEDGGIYDFKSLTSLVLKHVLEMGYTHVMISPVSEFVNDETFGYRTFGFYAVSERFGSSEDLKFFIDTLHNNGIGVIMELSYNHFSKEEKGLDCFDGTCLYEHLDPRKGVHPFYGTKIFNYERPEVKSFLLSNAFSWIEEYHIDGIKLDAVSNLLYLDYGRNEGEWVANIYGGNENLDAIEFIKHLNSVVKKNYPDVLLIADDDSGYPKLTESLEKGGLGFDLKFNNSMMEQFLDYMDYDPYFRSHHHNEISDNMIYQYNDNFVNSLSFNFFMGKENSLFDRLPGNEKDKFASLKLIVSYIFTHPGVKLLYQGTDIGDCGLPDFEREIEWSKTRKVQNKGVKAYVKMMNKLYKTMPALKDFDHSPDGFEWINNLDKDRNILSFARKAAKDEDTVVCVFNFSNIEQEIRVGAPLRGKYKLVVNSDDKEFGGKDLTNPKPQQVSEIGSDGREYSVLVKIAPLSFKLYKYVPFTEKEEYQIAKRKEAALAKTKASQYAEEYKLANEEYEKAKFEMEEARKRMEEAGLKAEKAKEMEEEEIFKAKKAMDEAK